jgi:hypothetical protein
VGVILLDLSLVVVVEKHCFRAGRGVGMLFFGAGGPGYATHFYDFLSSMRFTGRGATEGLLDVYIRDLIAHS